MKLNKTMQNNISSLIVIRGYSNENWLIYAVFVN